MNKKQMRLYVGGGVMGGGVSYRQKVLAIPDLLAFYPMADTGAVIADVGPNALNGAFAGTITSKNNAWTGGYYADFAAGFGNLYSASFNTLFTKAEVTINLFMQPADWVTGANIYYVQFMADTNNWIKIYADVDGITYFYYRSGGAQNIVYVDATCLSVDRLNMFTLTVSKANGRTRLYFNGGLVEEYAAVISDWVGNFASGTCGFGAYRVDDFLYAADANYSNVAIYNRELTQAEINKLLITPSPVISILGDSIMINNGNGSIALGVASELGYRAINHATSGNSIMAHMDAQTLAAASDGANIIIVQLGTNDGEDAGITAEYQENLLELKASNPGARIFGMGILNKTTETNRAANNAQISTACTNAGVTYWDTDGWVTAPGDLRDGIHPNSAGALKIKAAILARL